MQRTVRQVVLCERMTRAFGTEHVCSLQQRGLRFLEEAIELFHAAYGDRETAHKLIDYVFDRPAGDVAHELGDVGITTLAMGTAAGLDTDEMEQAALRRFLLRSPEDWRERNRAKNEAGFDAGAYPVTDPDAGRPRMWCPKCSRMQVVGIGCFTAGCPVHRPGAASVS